MRNDPIPRWRLSFWSVLVVWLGLFTTAASLSQPFSFILEEGVNNYQGTQDAALYSESPTFSNGGYEHIFSGLTRVGARLRRSTIRFDLTSIPAGTTVFGATLELVVSRTPSSCFSTPVSLHSILKDWNEGNVAGGNEGAASNPEDVTWNSNVAGIEDWATAGGDFGPASVAATVGCSVNSRVILNSVDLASDVQGWVDNASQNFGWMLVGDETASQSARRYYSSEGTSGRRPRLILSLDALPPNPSRVENWVLFD